MTFLLNLAELMVRSSAKHDSLFFQHLISLCLSQACLGKVIVLITIETAPNEVASLCLSRACLGEMIIFSMNMAPKVCFPHTDGKRSIASDEEARHSPVGVVHERACVPQQRDVRRANTFQRHERRQVKALSL
jgi:hypothetical protein